MSISVNTLSKEVCQHFLLLLGIISVCFLISGTPGTCEKFGSFSVTMENVSRNTTYAIPTMTAEITAMSRRKMVLYVVGELLKFTF